MATQYNHRNYIREQSPEMTREYGFPMMCGVETKSPGSQGKAKTGTEQKLRSTN